MAKLASAGATVGYDEAAVKALVKEVKVNVIDAAVKEMNSGLKTLNDKIDEIWVGQSANIFKQNMSKDVKAITTAMTKAKAVFETEMDAIEKAMANIDNAAVKKR